MRSFCVTRLRQSGVRGEGDSATESGASSWVVMATASRTCRIQVEDGGTLSVRPEAVVAWTGGAPTGSCRKLGLFDILLPRGPRDLLLDFHGPCIVWAEGSGEHRTISARNAAQMRTWGGLYGV